MTENHISGNALKLTLKCNFGFVNCARACVHVCVSACVRVRTRVCACVCARACARASVRAGMCDSVRVRAHLFSG